NVKVLPPPPGTCCQNGKVASPFGLRISPLNDFPTERSSLAWLVSVVTPPPSTAGGSKRRSSSTGGVWSVAPFSASTGGLASGVGLAVGGSAAASCAPVGGAAAPPPRGSG